MVYFEHFCSLISTITNYHSRSTYLLSLLQLKTPTIPKAVQEISNNDVGFFSTHFRMHYKRSFSRTAGLNTLQVLNQTFLKLSYNDVCRQEHRTKHHILVMMLSCFVIRRSEDLFLGSMSTWETSGLVLRKQFLP